jgi:hypothetical protein
VDAHPSQNWTAYKSGTRGGPTMADWSDGVMENWSSAERLLNTPALQHSITPFSGAIGQDPGIIGADVILDLTTLKPALNVALKITDIHFATGVN